MFWNDVSRHEAMLTAARPNQIHQSSLFSLWEWEKKWKDWLNLKGCGPLGGLSIHLWIEWSQGGRASHFLFLNEIKKEMKWAQQARAAFLFHFIPTIQSIKQTFLFELNDCWWNEESSPPAAAQRAANKTFSFMNERRKLLFCSSRLMRPSLRSFHSQINFINLFINGSWMALLSQESTNCLS